MEGVRRWIGQNPTSNAKKLHGKPLTKPETKKADVDPEIDPQSTETIARQLLDPFVSDEEEAEYQGLVYRIGASTLILIRSSYIDQCQDLLDAPSVAERKDLDLYQAIVRIAGGEMADSEDDIAESTFTAFIEKGNTQYLGRRDTLPTQFNYERWVGGAQPRI
jgi:phosphatidylinositol 3,5-bisphosphate 5-phosphatase